MDPLEFHKKYKGKIEILPKMKVSQKKLHLLYTPGVAAVAKEIAKKPSSALIYTCRGNNIAIITDGSRTMGVGKAIPEASIPVMEGKSVLFKSLGGINAYPLCLKAKSAKEIIRTIEVLSPNFSGFNIEDIESPKCFEIMEQLEKKNFLVFHDDREGAAIVTFAGLINALKVMGKKLEKVKICLAGAGAAGYGIFKIFKKLKIKNLIVFDLKGIIYRGRKGDSRFLREVARFSNPENLKDGLKKAIKGADVFIGFTGAGGLLKGKEVALMAKKPIIFALSNPVPEIFPKEIEKATKDYLFATGRSDFPNQINNALAFPGVFRAMLDTKKRVTIDIEIKIARALAGLVKHPSKKTILPRVFDKRLTRVIKNCF
jgi:malate dehydrogenase (oxaloacetate-decarboxylating)